MWEIVGIKCSKYNYMLLANRHNFYLGKSIQWRQMAEWPFNDSGPKSLVLITIISHRNPSSTQQFSPHSVLSVVNTYTYIAPYSLKIYKPTTDQQKSFSRLW